MPTNGDFKKYFDSLNKRFDSLEKQFDTVNKRFDAIEATLKAQGDSILSMQDTLAVVLRTTTANTNQIKRLTARVGSLEKEVERLDIGQTVLIKMVTDIRSLESGKTVELKEVRYDEVGQTLTGIVREKLKAYGKRKKRLDGN